MTARMISLGMKDKNGQELFADETVQIVNGANAGKELYKIRAAARAYTIEGNLSTKPDDPQPFQISSRKVMRLLKTEGPDSPK